MQRVRRASVVVALLCLVLSCKRANESAASDPSTTERAPAVTVSSPAVAAQPRTPEAVVEEFGRRMKQVSTTASPDVAAEAIRRNYRGLVEPALVELWAGHPSLAPGRRVSTPWPDRIEIESSLRSSVDEVTIGGVLVELSRSGDVRRTPLQLHLKRSNESWLISRFEEEAAPENDAQEATAVVNDYYRAIASHNYENAFACWGSSGPPGQTPERFVKGFDDTATVKAETGTPSRVEAAAGSRYIEVPVVVIATTKSGRSRRFEGTYTLRRSVVDGASLSDRDWHLYRASLRQVHEPVASSSYLNSVAPKRTASPSFSSA